MALRLASMAAALAITLLAPRAQADDPYKLLQSAGLLGTWSQDCRTEAMTGSMVLVRFTMTSLGVPRVIVAQPDFVMYSAQIEAAAPASGGQLNLTLDGGLSAAAAQVTLRLQAGELQILQAGTWGAPLQHCISE